MLRIMHNIFPRLTSVQLSAAAILALSGATALAHHSFAMFDLKKQMTLAGVVSEFQWTNPHVWIQLDVSEADGKVTHWSIESGSPRAMSQQGWGKDTLSPGDKVTLIINPMRSGSKGGALVSAVLPDGTRLSKPEEARPEKK